VSLRKFKRKRVLPKLGTVKNPRPFPHILPKTRMIPGQYLGWACRGCKLPMAIDTMAPQEARIPGDHIVEIKCSHCGQPQSHTWATRKELAYLPA
jgi:hypothetical protein